MQLRYLELPEYQFPHWIQNVTKLGNDNINAIMDINEWCGEQFGELGEVWGFERKSITENHPEGLNPVRIRLHYISIHYSWRFKRKQDAMTFKLAWGGL